MKPKAIYESEEQDLAQLMAKAEQENIEVSGDKEEEDEGLRSLLLRHYVCTPQSSDGGGTGRMDELS